MSNAISSIIRSVIRNTVQSLHRRLNIILFSAPPYEKYNYYLAKTNHNFYLWTENFDGSYRDLSDRLSHFQAPYPDCRSVLPLVFIFNGVTVYAIYKAAPLNP